jgi:hypothetical protein
MKIQNFITSAIVLFSSVSYASTAYVEQGSYGGISHGGYQDVTINANTAMVTFRGDSGDSPDKIKKYLLYRCAEVAMGYGYDYFVVVSTSLSSENINIDEKKSYKKIYPPRNTPYTEYSSRSIKGYTKTETSATDCQQSSSSICRTHAATMVIKMYNGSVPVNLPRAYAVTDILAHFAPST